VKPNAGLEYSAHLINIYFLLCICFTRTRNDWSASIRLHM